MGLQGIFYHYSNGVKLILFLVIALVSLFIGSLFSLSTVGFFYDVNLMKEGLRQLDNPEVVAAYKYLQWCNATALFIVPPLVFFYLTDIHAFGDYFSFRGIDIRLLILVIAIMFFLYPAINWLVEWNSEMNFPSFLTSLEEWMRAKEKEAELITKSFLKMDNWTDMVIMFLMIGVLPAIGEELVFRGVFQSLFTQMVKNEHTGIWLSAFLFSALHLQFFGFVPRFLLGVLFGYFLLWGRSIWYPILAHLFNNGSVVVLSYFYGGTALEKNLEKVGTADSIYLTVLSVSLLGVLLYVFHQIAIGIRR